LVASQLEDAGTVLTPDLVLCGDRFAGGNQVGGADYVLCIAMRAFTASDENAMFFFPRHHSPHVSYCQASALRIQHLLDPSRVRKTLVYSPWKERGFVGEEKYMAA